MSFGYGINNYGTGAYGDGAYSTLAPYGSAFASGDRVVRVTFTVEPLHFLTTGTGDVLNPRTWTLTEPSTGKIYTVMAVKEVSKLIYEILTLEPFPNHFSTLTLSTATLLTADRVPYPTLSFSFDGVFLNANVSDESKTVARGYYPKDIANTQVPLQADPTIGVQYGEMVGGTLTVTSAGDYESMSGEALVKKLILRRLVSKKGEFFHLPNYGIGLREKEPLPVVDLRALAVSIEQQVALEPEVAAVKANLAYSANASALVIQLKVQIRPTGSVVQVALAVPTGAIQF